MATVTDEHEAILTRVTSERRKFLHEVAKCRAAVRRTPRATFKRFRTNNRTISSANAIKEKRWRRRFARPKLQLFAISVRLVFHEKRETYSAQQQTIC